MISVLLLLEIRIHCQFFMNEVLWVYVVTYSHQIQFISSYYYMLIQANSSLHNITLAHHSLILLFFIEVNKRTW